MRDMIERDLIIVAALVAVCAMAVFGMPSPENIVIAIAGGLVGALKGKN
jgi:F0F1-type ATP synthase assembly protein I